MHMADTCWRPGAHTWPLSLSRLRPIGCFKIRPNFKGKRSENVSPLPLLHPLHIEMTVLS